MTTDPRTDPRVDPRLYAEDGPEPDGYAPPAPDQAAPAGPGTAGRGVDDLDIATDAPDAVIALAYVSGGRAFRLDLDADPFDGMGDRDARLCLALLEYATDRAMRRVHDPDAL